MSPAIRGVLEKLQLNLPKQNTNGKMPSLNRYISQKERILLCWFCVAPQSCDTQFFIIYPIYIRIVFIISSCILLSHFSYIFFVECVYCICCGVSVYFMLCVYLFSTWDKGVKIKFLIFFLSVSVPFLQKVLSTDVTVIILYWKNERRITSKTFL